MTMPKTKLAAQLYTVREFMQTENDFAKTIKKIKTIGYDAVQISGTPLTDAKFMKKVIDDNGIFCCATHEGIDNLINKFDEIVEKLKILDCPFTALGYPQYPAFFNNGIDGVKMLADKLNDIGRKFKEQGIMFGYHNHAVEFVKVSDKTFFEELFNLTEKEYVYAEIDTYWVQRGLADPVYWLKKLADRLYLIHYKDGYIGLDDEDKLAPVGEGNLNWNEIIKVSKELDIRWMAVEQDDSYGVSPFECLKTSLNNLHKFGLE